MEEVQNTKERGITGTRIFRGKRLTTEWHEEEYWGIDLMKAVPWDALPPIAVEEALNYYINNDEQVMAIHAWQTLKNFDGGEGFKKNFSEEKAQLVEEWEQKLLHNGEATR